MIVKPPSEVASLQCKVTLASPPVHLEGMILNLQVGQQISAPFLPTPAEVKKFEPRAGYFLLEVVLQDGHHTYKPLRIAVRQVIFSGLLLFPVQ